MQGNVSSVPWHWIDGLLCELAAIGICFLAFFEVVFDEE